MSEEAVPAGGQAAAAPAPRWRGPWLAVAGALAAGVCVAPPIEALAQRYVLASAVQFAAFAIAGPALIVLGAPWRWLRLARADGAGEPDGPFDRLAATRRGHRSFLRSGVVLLVFMFVAVVWWLPPVRNALVAEPALSLVELVTVLGPGVALWLELVPSAPLAPRLPRPQRGAVSALAMWCVWVVAYVIAFNNGPVFRAYGDLPGRALSLIADQEITAAILWVAAGFAFVPMVLITLLGWLNDSEGPEEEFQRRFARDENQRAVVRGWGRPATRRNP